MRMSNAKLRIFCFFFAKHTARELTRQIQTDTRKRPIDDDDEAEKKKSWSKTQIFKTPQTQSGIESRRGASARKKKPILHPKHTTKRERIRRDSIFGSRNFSYYATH